MKFNKYLMVSVILLTIITMGVASAASSDAASDDAVAAVTEEIDIISSDVKEITASGEDIATGSDVNDNSKLSASAGDEKLSAGSVAPNYTVEVTPNVTDAGNNYVAQYGQIINVRGSIENATGDVSIRFGYSGNYHDFTVPLKDGKFSQDITAYDRVRNNYQIQVKWDGNDYYKSISWSKNIHVKMDNVTANTAFYGLTPYMDVNLFDATGNVTFTLNGRTYTGKLENGKLVQEFTNYTIGRNTVEMSYEGDGVINPIEKSFTFTVDANIDAPTIYNYQPAIINVYFGDATGKASISLGNKSYDLDIKNGVVTAEFDNYVIGDNTLKVTYSGDDTFNPFETTKVFTVLDKEDAEIISSVYKTANKNFIFITIPHATGTINVTVNGKKEVWELVNETVIKDINPSDEINELAVSYDGNVRLNPTTSSFYVNLTDYIVNGKTWKNYFNQNDGGRLYDFIEDGITLDFQGSIINPVSANEKNIIISKPINVVSTTGDAYINLNTTAGSLLGEHPGSSFVVNREGSGSNISGIYLHNTELWISNTTNVVFDNISVVVEDQRVGSGVGATSVRDNSSYVTLKNSYFYTRNNGGSTTFTFSWAHHCIFDNNTVKAEGAVGNLLYLNVYNIKDVPKGVPVNTYNQFINNRIYGKEGSAISVGIMVEGAYNIIANNTLYKCSASTSFGGAAAHNNTYYGNTMTEGSGLTAQTYSIVYGNNVTGALSTGANSVAYDNTVGKAMTVGKESEAYGNTVGGLTLSGASAIVHDNIVKGATTISQTGVQVYDNTFEGDNTIKFSNANAKNVVFANNTVNGNIEFANANAKNNTIVNNTITTSKEYAIDLKTYTNTENVIADNILNSKSGFGNDAVNHKDDETIVVDNFQNETASISVSVDNIKVGQKAVFNVETNVTTMTSANIAVNGKTYVVSLTNGKGSVEVEDLLSGSYEVLVTSADKEYGAQNVTSLDVTKNDCPAIDVVVPEITQWIESEITVTIKDATGKVTLTVNGIDVDAELVNGVATIAVPDLAFGEYNYTITYPGDFKYLGNETNGTLTVNKNKEVKIIASDVVDFNLADKFTAQFTNYIGEAIANANVTIAVGEEIFSLVTDENGTATAYFVLFRGKYDVNVTFNEIPGEFDAASAGYTVKVIDGSIIKIVSVNGDGSITGLLCDIIGEPIANAEIIASMDGSNTTLTTNDAGLFEFKAKNGLKVDFKFKGDNVTTGSDSSIILNNVSTIVKDTVITASSVSRVAVDTGAKEKGKAYKFTLKDADGNVLANKTVKVTLNGNVYTTTTNENGTGSVVISLGVAKKYNLNVFFMGDNDYKGSTAAAKITVTKKKTTLKAAKTKYTFKAKAKSKVIKATLKTSNKYLKTGKKVTIKIKGKTYTAKTGKNGAIKLNIKQLTKKGTYKAIIKFAGDSTYKASSSKTIKIIIK